MRRIWLALVSCTLTVACGDDDRAPSAEPPHGPLDASVSIHDTHDTDVVHDAGMYTFPCLFGREATHEASFTSVYIDIFCHAGCTNFYCHGSSGQWGDLDLSSSIEVAYQQLVGHRSGTSIPADNRPTCRESDMLRVTPGRPEQSLLYLKVTAQAPCGTHMPPAYSDLPLLQIAEQEQIRQWILAGAPLHALQTDAAVPADAGERDAGVPDAAP